MKRIVFTQDGYNALLDEKKELEKKRKVTIADLQKAREMGDLSENGFYKATKSRLGQLDSRIFEVDMLIKHAMISEQTNDSINIGSTVHLDSEKGKQIYKIVGDFEANILENKISTRSPLGKALVGRKAGENIEVSLPNHTMQYKIISIE